MKSIWLALHASGTRICRPCEDHARVPAVGNGRAVTRRAHQHVNLYYRLQGPVGHSIALNKPAVG
jgi:hypothetical protein